MMVYLQRCWKAWDEFWFAPRSLLNLAVFRILLMSAMASMYWSRLRDVNLYFSDQGILPKSDALQIYVDFYRPQFLLAAWPDSWTYSLHLCLVLGSIALALGLGGRILNLIVWLLHLAFFQRNFAIAFGADAIGGLFMFLMIGTQSCARLSLWNCLRAKIWRGSAPAVRSDLLTSVCYRLLQFQLVAIYMWTGLEKLKGASWWDGTALWTVLANPQMVVFDITWIRSIPLVVAIFTVTTLVFEIYFPALVLMPKVRKKLLAFGALFHLGIAFLMALWGFAIVMISPYILFMEEAWSEKALLRFKLRQGFSRD